MSLCMDCKRSVRGMPHPSGFCPACRAKNNIDRVPPMRCRDCANFKRREEEKKTDVPS